MPNIREQRIDQNGIYIKASDGREWTLTRQDIRDIFQAQTGNAATRRQRTLDAVKQSAVAALGAEQVPAELMDFDFDTADGRPSLLTIRGG